MQVRIILTDPDNYADLLHPTALTQAGNAGTGTDLIFTGIRKRGQRQ
jgi:hypothetical protein